MILDAIDYLWQMAEDYPTEGFRQRLESLRQDFLMMREYMLHGMQDPKREELFRGMKKKLMDIYYDLQVRSEVMENTLLLPYRRYLVNRDLSIEALQLQLTNAGDEQSHYDALTKAFYALIVSYQWKKSDMNDWTEFLVSPSLRDVDCATLVSALTLSLFENYSARKAECLAQVYVRSQSELVRQRAFVGVMLAESRRYLVEKGPDVYGESSEPGAIDILSCSPDFASALKEMFIQLLTCTNAEKDSRELQDNIMPNILKNQPFIITNHGIQERDANKNPDGSDAPYDPMADEREERNMEEMEQSVNKMMDMQRSGADVFYGGFSHMKRYSFFYKAMNWFMPFYKEHPDMQQYTQKIGKSSFFERVCERGPFCESDKYSFVIALSDLMGKTTDKMKEMMESGELGPIGMFPEGEHTVPVSYLRLQYLQDLYRFYKLSSMGHQLYNPFADITKCALWLCALDRVEDKDKKDMCLFLVKKDALMPVRNVIAKILNSFKDRESFDRCYCHAEFKMLTKDYPVAIAQYNKCLAQKDNDFSVLRSLARAYYSNGDYEKAAFTFDALHTMRPESLSYQLNYAMAMTKSGKAADVVNMLFKLEYEHPDNITISNTLGWTLMFAGKKEQALTTLMKHADNKAVSQNLAYAHLINNNMSEAVKLLHIIPKDQRMESMREDADLLGLYGIGEAEMAMLVTDL